MLLFIEHIVAQIKISLLPREERERVRRGLGEAIDMLGRHQQKMHQDLAAAERWMVEGGYLEPAQTRYL